MTKNKPKNIASHPDDMKRGVDFIGVGVVFYCHDGKGNILFHKRSAVCRDEQGRWDCGAGAMEFRETFEEAVKREIEEEYCATPLEIKYLTTRNVIRNNNGTPTHWIANMHAVLVDPKKVAIGDHEKIEKLGWFTLERLPSPLHSAIEKEILFLRTLDIFKK